MKNYNILWRHKQTQQIALTHVSPEIQEKLSEVEEFFARRKNETTREKSLIENDINKKNLKLVEETDPIKRTNLLKQLEKLNKELSVAETLSCFGCNLQEFAARNLQSSMGNEYDIIACDVHELGAEDQEFFDAWDYDAVQNSVVININKARDVFKNILRQRRADVLQELDSLQARYFFSGNSPAAEAVERRKQELRDATSDIRILRSNTIEELRNLLSEIITKENKFT